MERPQSDDAGQTKRDVRAHCMRLGQIKGDGHRHRSNTFVSPRFAARWKIFREHPSFLFNANPRQSRRLLSNIRNVRTRQLRSLFSPLPPVEKLPVCHLSRRIPDHSRGGAKNATQLGRRLWRYRRPARAFFIRIGFGASRLSRPGI
jgi:hypothetical protein